MIRSIVLKMSGITNDVKNTKMITDVNLAGNDPRTVAPPMRDPPPTKLTKVIVKQKSLTKSMRLNSILIILPVVEIALFKFILLKLFL